MSRTNPITTYPVKVTYFKRGADGKGGLVEIETSATVNVCRLSRTSVEHTKFGLSLIQAGRDLDETADLACRFVKMTIDDEKVVKDLQNDLVACISLFNNEDVQEDINRFLSTWGLLETEPSSNPRYNYQTKRIHCRGRSIFVQENDRVLYLP